jgi:predicted dehydrogenase
MRLAILSFAHLHAEAYIHNLRAIPDAEFIGFTDEDHERGVHFARMFNAHRFDSYAQLLAEKPDGVVICSENARHLPLVEMAASAGIPYILCEKPLMTRLEDGHAILSAVEHAGAHLMTAFPMRFNMPAREIRALIESGKLGRLYGLNTTNQGECPAHLRGWFVDKALAGGGALIDHIVHLTDLMRWYMNSEVVEVYAQANHILYHHDAPDVETGGLVMLTFDNGVFASIDCSWSKPTYYPTWGGLTMEIVGEGGLATMDAFRQVLTIYSHPNKRPLYGYWGSDANQLMIDEFAAAIREGRAPAVTGYDGFKAAEVALAAYRSVETGEPVKLPLT